MQGSVEFRLAVECCRGAFAGARGESLRAPTSAFDWARFSRFVRFHRIEGLVWDGLSRSDLPVPADISGELSAAAQAVAAHNLRAAAECGTLQEHFASARVPLLFLKGLALGALAYRNPVLKAAVDIDLLIDPAELGEAADVLRGCGYRQLIPAANRSLRAWHRGSKESVWLKREPPFQIDLHTRAADNPHLIPGITVRSPSQMVSTGRGQELRTLADEDLFAYLAVHGGTSTWFRLKWISDFAGFLHPREAAEIERLYRRSHELGAGRAAGQGLRLADRLFDTLRDNPALRDELQRDRVTRLLVDLAFALLSREPAEPTERFLGTVPLHLSPFLLQRGWSYKISEASGQAAKLLNHFIF